ncbi:MAG TPA: hypothetical protein VD735_00185 [Candidatus Saccharimonadales bacterium]|nr:hypothetical protein [Candidatus Saccharimonadales bacterium]
MAGEIRRLKNGLDMVTYTLEGDEFAIFPAHPIVAQERTQALFGIPDTTVIGQLLLHDMRLYVLRTQLPGHDSLLLADRSYNAQEDDGFEHSIEVGRQVCVRSSRMPRGMREAVPEAAVPYRAMVFDQLRDNAFAVENATARSALLPLQVSFAVPPPSAPAQ